MRKFLILLLIPIIFCGILPRAVFAADSQPSFGCWAFGWLVQGIGWCESNDSAPIPFTVPSIPEAPTQTMVVEQATNQPPKSAVVPATATQPIIERVTNEYVTIQQTGVTEARLDERITEVIRFIDTKLQSLQNNPVSLSGEIATEDEYVTKEYLLKSLDKVNDNDASFEATDISELENLQLSGTTILSGSFGIGMENPPEVLSVNGPVYLAETTPSITDDRLYNVGGNLYWNGSPVSGSSTDNWSSLSGNTYRLTGNVGIGTTTPDATLSVVGDANISGTLTAAILDTGGQVCNVEAYGAVGDNSTLNDAAIAAAIADCPEGGTIYFPMGQFRITNPIVLDRPVTIRGAYSPRWSYSSSPRSSIRANFGTFSGTALIHVRDRSISGEVNHNNGGRIEHISLDGGSTGSSVEGIYFEGLVRDWKLTDVDISQVTGNGFEAAVGSGEGNPRGFTIRGLSIYSADGHGFRATALNDSYIDDLLAVGNALRGIYISSMGETKMANSRAVFNALEGLYIDGASNNGGLTFTDFSTDRNDRHGVRISATGTTTITFNGLLTRRDGPNLGGGTETPYAGVAIIGSTTDKVAPVFINGLSQIVGVDDSGNPPVAPLVGVRATNATYVKIDGQLWGVTNGYQDGGGNDHFIVEDDSIVKTGTSSASSLYTNLSKWQATSSGLFYGGGNISIGSATGTRLLNIIAPSQAGARLQDTTNNVTLDVRAEDFQAFIGTFSNHQLRFQTNNTSRLTIDTNGSIGIGTTSPTAQLHTTGSVRFQTFGVGSLQTDANGNVSVSSDVRLKDVLNNYEAGLDEVLQINPIRYRWNRDSGFDTKTVYAGFSAQNIESVLPEAVGHDANNFLTLSDRPILAAVVNAIKELWQEVTGNTNRIQLLEERVRVLEEQLNGKIEIDESLGEEVPDPITDIEDTETPTEAVVIPVDDESVPEEGIDESEIQIETIDDTEDIPPVELAPESVTVGETVQ